MNQAYLCIFLALVFPLTMAAVAKFGGMRQGVIFDNHAPRSCLAMLSGWPQRANWAQQNCWEAFPIFAVSVFMAEQSGFPPGNLAVWSWIFIATRFVYVLCYLMDVAVLRSLCWGVGICVCFRLMLAAI